MKGFDRCSHQSVKLIKDIYLTEISQSRTIDPFSNSGIQRMIKAALQDKQYSSPAQSLRSGFATNSLTPLIVIVLSSTLPRRLKSSLVVRS